MLDLWLNFRGLWRAGLITTKSQTVLAVFFGFLLSRPVGVARVKPIGLLGWLALGHLISSRACR